MRLFDDSNDLGPGGRVLVALAGIVTFIVLRFAMDYEFLTALAFAVAAALLAWLLLGWLADAIDRSEPEDHSRKVRKIVPTGSQADLASPSASASPNRPAAASARAEPATNHGTAVTPLSAVETMPATFMPKSADPEPDSLMAGPAEVAATTRAAKAAKAPAKTKAAAKTKAPTKTKAPAKTKAAAKVAEIPAAAPKSKAEPKAKAASRSKPKAADAGLERLAAPRNGRADDLKEIEGIGPAMEKLVNSLGFYHFDQVAAWSEADVALIDAGMKTFKGRITRDKWVAQARIIVTEGLEAFRERAKTNNY